MLEPFSLLSPGLKIGGYIVTIFQKLFGGKSNNMRASLYLELGRNIGRLQNVVDLRRQNVHAQPHELVEQVISEERYNAAKKDSDTFYSLPEADLIDNYYKTFRKLSDITKMLPIEFCQQTIAHFFLMLQKNILNRKVMKKGASAWLLSQIKAVEPPPWWRRSATPVGCATWK